MPLGTPANTIKINRAPVLTLWTAVVAERLGFDPDEALSIGKALSGLTAQTKGRMLGIFQPGKGPDGGPPKKFGLGEEFWVQICGRGVPAKNTEAGVRAVVKDQPIDPAGVRRYLEQKFGENLATVREAMEHLAKSCEPEKLGDLAYPLYEKFRPKIPAGKAGWGAAGELDLELIRSLAVKR